NTGVGLVSVETNSDGATQINGGSVRTTGTQTYDDDVTLGADTELNGSEVTFGKKVDGAGKSLTVNAGGVTIFGGAVGSGGALGSVETDEPGSTAINGGSVSAGTQTYKDDVTLGFPTTVLSGSGIEFRQTLNGASALTVNTTGGGSTVFGGAVGDTTELLSVETNSDGSTRINGDVTTTGDQIYHDDVTVAGGKKLGAGQDIILGDGKTLTGLGALTLEAKRSITLGGAMGGNINAAGKLTLKADAVGGGAGDVHAYGTIRTTSDGIDASGVDLTFEKAVESAAGMKLNATGKLLATGTLDAKGGDVELYASDDADKGINLEDNVTASRDILLKNNTKVSGGKTLQSGHDVVLADGKTLTGEGDLTVNAMSGQIVTDTAGSKLKIHMNENDRTLRLTQKERLLLTTGFEVTDSGDPTPKDTHLVAEVTGGSLEDSTADQWKSITATTQSGIALRGAGNITTNTLNSTAGNISVHSTNGNLRVDGNVNEDLSEDAKGDSIGGVLLRADAGRIYTSGGTNDILNVKITGRSDQAADIGVGLPYDSAKKAAIVIQSHDDLKIGANTTLTAKGTYDPINSNSGAGSVDDRDAVDFQRDGDPIDIAVYLASRNADVAVDSKVTLPTDSGVATMAVDALDTVEFNVDGNGSFQSYDNFHAATRLEAVSRITESLNQAEFEKTLPYAREVAGDLAPSWFKGERYVLRGMPSAEVLGMVGPAPVIPPPVRFDPEDQEEVAVEKEDPNIEDDITLAFGEDFFQVPIEGAMRDMIAVDKEITKEPRLRIQKYWRTLDPNRTPSSGQVILILNKQMETLEEPNRNNVGRFDQALRSNPAVGQWLDAVVGFVVDSNDVFGHDVDKLAGTIQDRFVRRFKATSKVQQYMGRYIRIMAQPRQVAPAQETTVESPAEVVVSEAETVTADASLAQEPTEALFHSSVVPTGRQMLDYWKVIEETSPQVISILSKEVKAVRESANISPPEFEQILLKNPVVGQWADAMLDFLSGIHQIQGSIRTELATEIFDRVLPAGEIDGEAQASMIRHIMQELTYRQIHLD
ncbi:MAG: hypothetical protein JXN61_14205, partial [Sedimentisphaerales bacterium]|nr:hypothetical protein [Sedimentisphaerales bacterium]